MLGTLVQPYTKVMSDLPGGTHNCSTSTVLNMSEAMEMSPMTTVWGDFGSGAPILAIQGGVFAKQTLCLDLPSVMKMVQMILYFMNNESKGLINQIYLESGYHTSLFIRTDSSLGDINQINELKLPPIFFDITHLTCFIGGSEVGKFILFSSFRTHHSL